MVRGTKPCYMLGVGEDLIPDGDIGTQGVWKNEAGGSTLAPSLADSSDATYVYGESPRQAGDYFEVSLSNPQYSLYPTAAHLIIWRTKNNSVQTLVVKLEIKQDTTVIATDQQTLTGSILEFVKKLTQAEVNQISNYNNLRARYTVVSVS